MREMQRKLVKRLQNVTDINVIRSELRKLKILGLLTSAGGVIEVILVLWAYTNNYWGLFTICFIVSLMLAWDLSNIQETVREIKHILINREGK